MAGIGTAAGSAKAVTMMIACVVIIVGVIGGMVILSIISTFTQDGSKEVNGEEYKCPAVMLKSIYTNVTDTFANGTIAANPSLSSLNTMAYKSITGEKNVAGCIMESNYGWGSYNDSTTTSKRRRRATTAGLYSVGVMRCFYSTPCSNKGSVGKYSNATDLSTCIKKRLAAANSVFTKSGALTEWTPVPNSLTYSIVNALSTGYIALSIQKVFGVRPSNAASIGSSFSSNALSSSTQSQILAGCSYAGQLSQSAIAAAIASQYTQTTTLPTTPASG